MNEYLKAELEDYAMKIRDTADAIIYNIMRANPNEFYHSNIHIDSLQKRFNTLVERMVNAKLGV